MCNLDSSSRSQDEIRRTFAIDRDEAGNLPPLPGIFPDQMAPIIHAADGERVHRDTEVLRGARMTFGISSVRPATT